MDTSILSGITMVILQVSSPSFSANGDIPSKFTCEGENISPALSVTNIPVQTKSLAVIVEDPDAPSGTVTHWVCWDIDPTITIAEKSTAGIQGKNSKGSNGYMGPCPPNGTHHYHFKIYALDQKLDLPEGASKTDLENVMKDHILGSGELVGLYKKMN
jgi:Raf kinase inhibitor-like YbhB/YbcL family protein